MGQLSKDQIDKFREEGFIQFKGLFDAKKSRWAMVCCYNTRSNDPYKESHHPGYTPLKKVDDSMIRQVVAQSFEEGAQG